VNATLGEDCDGTADSACPGLCDAGCTCSSIAPPAPLPDPNSEDAERVLTIILPSPASGAIAGLSSNETAIQFELASLHHPALPPDSPDMTAFEGELRYVNAFHDAVTNEVIVDCPDSKTFGTYYKCAALGCEPEYLDWVGLTGGQPLHISGSAAVPTSIYSVRQLSASCAGNEVACASVSASLVVQTVDWGDATGNGSLNVSDVVQVVDRVRDIAGALGEPYVLVRQQTTNGLLQSPNVQDIVFHVDALRGFAYPFGIDSCP